MKISPRNLHKVRSQMIEQLDEPFYFRYLTEFAGKDYLPYRPGETRKDRVREDKETLRQATLYSLSENMSALAYTAAKSLPHYRLEETDVLCPTGLMFWDGAPLRFKDYFEDKADLPICAISWTRMDNVEHAVNGILVCCYTSRDEIMDYFLTDGSIFQKHVKSLRRAFTSPVSLALGRYLWVPFGELPGLPDIDTALGMANISIAGRRNSTLALSDEQLSAARAMALLKTSWLLIKQEGISDQEEVAAPKATARQLTRLGHPTDAVRVIDIRRRGGGTKTGEAGPSPYGVRWMVDGHWRNQWYPSLNAHRPKWISPYLKGPEDAPLLTGEKVKRLGSRR